MHSLVLLSESAARLVPQDREPLAGEHAGELGRCRSKLLLKDDVVLAVLSEQRGHPSHQRDGAAIVYFVHQRAQRHRIASPNAHRCELYSFLLLFLIACRPIPTPHHSDADSPHRERARPSPRLPPIPDQSPLLHRQRLQNASQQCTSFSPLLTFRAITM